ncbi:MAG TPA: tRNA (guanosine(37)-N1)-methyltransferase TrmD [Polyangiaceae bacterium LLY-WYZ-15_(1-7)]|nr:tRNA (guanosine(37)-N1)-methyltransferase TrmD [Myxococcales bacterium]MAT24166.1 tRNA (guanosine(37)-N1)-methyltransferase TrmD [Sandaracinus sp.]HJK94785.1 tRNA (guanosine(37)-N1)-methyltransferase TrmD [Polyangiaceae bacterium LLY-WYZ-15_(1-7)]MBJ74410.1 tRNA (guanosine(37)-N1)-methyltransferase TrmD [Sandaracinus sp.]HJL00013.1 tRNA (guanosine(37)-N1)-methyltransferase TrmD [Polyangiaceae bacterium LLY-WYZ-15_(1-7)]
MRFELVTIFPEFAELARVGLLGKAIEAGHAELVARSPREFTADRHRSVDDAPYGGGSGMVMMPGPVVETLEALDAERGGPTRRVLLSPQGARFEQGAAERFAALPALTLVCGRYEGFDERIRHHVDEEISLGDFVLLGGEIAALAIIEATARLVPGVLGNAESASEESHTTGILEYPQYTRPAEFRGEGVPEVLLSGHHAKIARWRRKEALRRTRERRPDLLAAATLSAEDRKLLAELDAEDEA